MAERWVRLIRSHRNRCRQIQSIEHGDEDGRPWAAMVARTEWRSRTGRAHRHAYHVWAIVPCNDPDCPAEMAVKMSSVVDAAEREFRRATNREERGEP